MSYDLDAEAKRIEKLAKKFRKGRSHLWSNIFFDLPVEIGDGSPSETIVCVSKQNSAHDGARLYFYMGNNPNQLWTISGAYSEATAPRWSNHIYPAEAIHKLVVQYETRQ